ncbi:beta-lactamase/transpeptidase-like protein [Punctularia strigosozonata HHB-11173 SS5]|uniref:beta-lactamase/transpeptidase-like protein n=1 Tax=Punctularia strigosozonata (strain HHB-11173) TaxID=741275 RepID=UPI0004416C24|nr:beta-lactamase/transpeptidase-like protein [Punctularia strigosozonata HHB-11173 SS5]EIN11010.1 beta-lactamase/transpeptidase-like protein [Punctularia strigosozonata HHB-11173 SS5]
MGAEQHCSRPSSPNKTYRTLLRYAAGSLACFFLAIWVSYRRPPRVLSLLESPPRCSSSLPPELLSNPPSSDTPAFKHLARRLDQKLARRVAHPDMDSLAVAVVTSSGTVFEGTYGVVRANESSNAHVDRDTIYRLASVSKIFTALETWLLVESGKLEWDRPISDYIPQYTPPCAASGRCYSPTLRDLASHRAGVGSNLPPGDMSLWPHSLQGAGTPPENGRPFPSEEEVLEAINRYSTGVPLGKLPVYSNTGYAFLGMVNSAAAASKSGQKPSHAELIQRDVFSVLNMSGSGFLTSVFERERIAVPSSFSDAADYDFRNAMNPAGGQVSSLADMAKATSALLKSLDPATTDSLLSSTHMQQWLSTSYAWDDGITEPGHSWIALLRKDKWKRTQRLYQSFGQLNTFHSAWTINPRAGYGVVVLMTGDYPDSQDFTIQLVDAFQPAFDDLLEVEARKSYVGRWSTAGTSSPDSEMVTSLRSGTLWVDKLTLNGTDTLGLLQGTDRPEPVMLWHTGAPGRFRLASGIPFFNKAPNYGCLSYFYAMDVGYAAGVPVTEIVFSGAGSARAAHFPSALVDLHRLQD